MKTWLKQMLWAMLLISVLASCAILPAGMAWFQDMRQVGAVHTMEIEPVSSGSSDDYSLVQRLQLLSAANNIDTQSVSFSTGIQYSEQTAIENVRVQIDRLYTLGVLPFGSESITSIGIDMVAYTVDSSNPLCSIMEWIIPINFNNGYSGFLNMDDNTGLVCSIALWVENRESGVMQLWSETDVETCAAAWAKYLGLAVMKGESLATTATRAKTYYDEKGIVIHGSGFYNFTTDVDAAAENAVVAKEDAVQLKEKYGISIFDSFLSDGVDAIPYRIYAEPNEFWQISIL